MEFKNSYRNLDVWKKSIAVGLEIYESLKKFPNEEKYVLIDQMKRASISIASNIAEGYSQDSTKSCILYLTRSRASAAEIETQLIFSYKLGYISKDKFEDLLNKNQEIGKMLSGLIKSLRNKIKSEEDTNL